MHKLQSLNTLNSFFLDKHDQKLNVQIRTTLSTGKVRHVQTKQKEINIMPPVTEQDNCLKEKKINKNTKHRSAMAHWNPYFMTQRG